MEIARWYQVESDLVAVNDSGRVVGLLYAISDERLMPDKRRPRRPPKQSQGYVENIPPMLNHLEHRAMASRVYAQVKNIGENA